MSERCHQQRTLLLLAVITISPESRGVAQSSISIKKPPQMPKRPSPSLLTIENCTDHRASLANKQKPPNFYETVNLSPSKMQEHIKFSRPSQNTSPPPIAHHINAIATHRQCARTTEEAKRAQVPRIRRDMRTGTAWEKNCRIQM